jgi:hypothetical protein
LRIFVLCLYTLNVCTYKNIYFRLLEAFNKIFWWEKHGTMLCCSCQHTKKKKFFRSLAFFCSVAVFSYIIYGLLMSLFKHKAQKIHTSKLFKRNFNESEENIIFSPLPLLAWCLLLARERYDKICYQITLFNWMWQSITHRLNTRWKEKSNFIIVVTCLRTLCRMKFIIFFCLCRE